MSLHLYSPRRRRNGRHAHGINRACPLSDSIHSSCHGGMKTYVHTLRHPSPVSEPGFELDFGLDFDFGRRQYWRSHRKRVDCPERRRPLLHPLVSAKAYELAEPISTLSTPLYLLLLASSLADRGYRVRRDSRILSRRCMYSFTIHTCTDVKDPSNIRISL